MRKIIGATIIIVAVVGLFAVINKADTAPSGGLGILVAIALTTMALFVGGALIFEPPAKKKLTMSSMAHKPKIKR